ncbi:hypothetical protein D3C85_1451010 [compost metagenome]
MPYLRLIAIAITAFQVTAAQQEAAAAPVMPSTGMSATLSATFNAVATASTRVSTR